ncbi:hypothetical protein C2E21_0196 [Chlorella sorokiniana]|uniref:Uncharacterized protein n=1 Tax=Chlorella sorokiniana TaxID=3076 RepID=A0A2P6U407_CHLSO|nr:hypothetical protein C2E21_0196 [Chlorella sorokiniana]|eukprot:PRW61039.1 hypothetical protein C2E21_0196 [Chlorella sorokiniana]
MPNTRETVIWREVLPEACCEAVQADAAALAECPNYWVPRDVVEGREPAITAAEQIVQQLYRRLVAARLAPHADAFLGAEYWCQIYERGRGLGFHYDKDEHAMKEEGRMVNPLFSSVYYVTGSSEEGSLRQAPTLLCDQWYNHEEQCSEPEYPAWSSFVFPRRNQYCLFGGCQAHGVLEAMPQEPGIEDQPPRIAFLVNWWATHPKSVLRATADDLAAGRVAPATDVLALDDTDTSSRASEPRRVQIVCLDAPALQEGELLPIDELLEQQGVRLSGEGAADALTIRHPGLTLFPLDDQCVDAAGPQLQVMAALMLQEVEESGKNDPEVLARRRKEQEELDAAVTHMLEHNPGRVPSWDARRIMQMDWFCLRNGKRCVMWDDQDVGFFLMLNWDWLRNQPSEPSSPDQLIQPGWWANLRQLLRPPLLDPEQPAERLASWIDKHTMRVHAGLLDKLHLLRLDESTQQLVLDDPYWQQLQVVARQDAEEQPAAAGPAAGQAAGSAEAAAEGTQTQ